MYTAKIGFSVPSASTVTVEIYDSTGKLIAVPVDEDKPAGIYKVEFDGNELTRGIYYYQLRINEYLISKRFFIIK